MSKIVIFALATLMLVKAFAGTITGQIYTSNAGTIVPEYVNHKQSFNCTAEHWPQIP